MRKQLNSNTDKLDEDIKKIMALEDEYLENQSPNDEKGGVD